MKEPKLKRKLANRKPLINPLSPVSFVEYLSKQIVERTFPAVSPELLNSKQRLVYEAVVKSFEQSTPRRIICHGEAGTGKSFIISAIRTYCKSHGIRFRTFAFTGCAAFNVGGQTIHSGLSLRLGYRKKQPEENVQYPAERLRGVKLIVFDELSLIGLSLLGYIERRLRAMFNSEEPFGGIMILLLGDFAQLRPVGDKILCSRNSAAVGLERDGIRAYSFFEHAFILTEIMRQGPEQGLFKTILSEARVGKLTPANQKILEARFVKNFSEEELMPFLDAPFLFGDNLRVNQYNEYRIKEIGNEIVEIKSHDTRRGKVLDNGHFLSLAVGARVMITRNLCVKAGLFNGALATVTEICSEPGNEGQPKYIFIRPDKYYGVKYALRNDIPIAPSVQSVWDPEDRMYFKRMQYPLRLAYAVTVHRAQGQTYNRVALGLPGPGIWGSLFYYMSPQLFYVALGRCKSLEGVIFTQPFTRQLISDKSKLLKEWQEEVDRLRRVEAETIEQLF